MAAGAGADAFQHIDECDQVAGDIFVRAGERAPYPGLRGQVNHGFKVAVTEEAFRPRAVGQIQGKEPESWSYAELAQARVFQPGIVVVVKVVDAHYFKSTRKEALNQVRANKAGSTRDQNSFFSCLLHHFFLTDKRFTPEMDPGS